MKLSSATAFLIAAVTSSMTVLSTEGAGHVRMKTSTKNQGDSVVTKQVTRRKLDSTKRYFFPQLADEHPDGVIIGSFDVVEIDVVPNFSNFSAGPIVHYEHSGAAIEGHARSPEDADEDDDRDWFPIPATFDGGAPGTSAHQGWNLARRLQDATDSICGDRQVVHMLFNDTENPTFDVVVRPRNTPEFIITLDAYKYTEQDQLDILRKTAAYFKGFPVDMALDPPSNTPKECITTVKMGYNANYDWSIPTVRETKAADGEYRVRSPTYGASDTLDFHNRIRNATAWVDSSIYVLAYHFWGAEGLADFTLQNVSDTLSANDIIQAAMVEHGSKTAAHELAHSFGVRHHDGVALGFPIWSDPAYPPGHVLLPPLFYALENVWRLMAPPQSSSIVDRVTEEAFFSERSAIKLALALGIDWSFLDGEEAAGSAARDTIFGTAKSSKSKAQRTLHKSSKSSKSSKMSGGSKNEKETEWKTFDRRQFIFYEGDDALSAPLTLKEMYYPNTVRLGYFADGDVAKASVLAIEGTMEISDPSNIPAFPTPVDVDEYIVYFEEGQLVTAETTSLVRGDLAGVKTALKMTSESGGIVICDNFNDFEYIDSLCYDIVIPVSGNYKVEVQTFDMAYGFEGLVPIDPLFLEGWYDLIIYSINGTLNSTDIM